MFVSSVRPCLSKEAKAIKPDINSENWCLESSDERRKWAAQDENEDSAHSLDPHNFRVNHWFQKNYIEIDPKLSPPSIDKINEGQHEETCKR